jgi:hypothetical protein
VDSCVPKMKNASCGLAIDETQFRIHLVYQKIDFCQGRFRRESGLTCLELTVCVGSPRKVHSMRRAFMGSIPAARLAGMRAAKKEQIAKATAAIVRADGSQEETP